MEVGLFWFQWLAVTFFFLSFFACLDVSALLDVSLAASLVLSGCTCGPVGFTYPLTFLTRGPSYFQMLQDFVPKLSHDEPVSGCQGGRGEKVSVGRRNSCSNPNEYLHVIKFGKQFKG